MAEQPAAPFLPTPHSLAEVDMEETGTRRLEIDPHARGLRARPKLPVSELGYLLAPTPQSSDDTRIADLATAHHHLIPIKHRSYPNTVNYYLDSTNYRLSKTKTIQLTQLDCFGLGEAGVGGVEVVVNSVGVGVVFKVDKVVVGGGEFCDVCVLAALCAHRVKTEVRRRGGKFWDVIFKVSYVFGEDFAPLAGCAFAPLAGCARRLHKICYNPNPAPCSHSL